MIGFIFNFNP